MHCGYSQLHDHHYFRLAIVRCQALHQFGMMEGVHQLDFFLGSVSLFRTPTLIELPSKHLTGLLMAQAIHMTELPSEGDRGKKNKNKERV